MKLASMLNTLTKILLEQYKQLVIVDSLPYCLLFRLFFLLAVHQLHANKNSPLLKLYSRIEGSTTKESVLLA
jgi:hypothetical protein